VGGSTTDDGTTDDGTTDEGRDRAWEARRTSFGAVADLYERARPDYPAAAIEWIAGPAPTRVLDLGAGTGKLTAGLVAAGHRVVAVEPDAGMRALLEELAVRLPGVRVLAGAAEQIPLPDAAVDVVTAGQAFHWFDGRRALPEIARVLRPGGRLAPVWNIRDNGTGWVAELDRVLGGDDRWSAFRSEQAGDFGPLFGPVVERHFRHAQPLDPAGLRATVLSRSYVQVLPPGERAALLTRLDRLVAAHPDLAGRDSFDLPYVAVVRAANRAELGDKVSLTS